MSRRPDRPNVRSPYETEQQARVDMPMSSSGPGIHCSEVPWPRRAVPTRRMPARSQYRDFLGQSCMSFSSVPSAIARA
jgi:hypothetical protein